MIADTRTNSVLLSGSGAARLQYRALVAHLDTPSAQGGDTLVRYLNYADAEELATKLQAQFGGTDWPGRAGSRRRRRSGRCRDRSGDDLGGRGHERARDQRAGAQCAKTCSRS